jgi:hypothetical protein
VRCGQFLEFLEVRTIIMIHGFGIVLDCFMIFHILVRLCEKDIIFMIDYHGHFKNIVFEYAYVLK